MVERQSNGRSMIYQSAEFDQQVAAGILTHGHAERLALHLLVTQDAEGATQLASPAPQEDLVCVCVEQSGSYRQDTQCRSPVRHTALIRFAKEATVSQLSVIGKIPNKFEKKATRKST